jgi:hypothetical protein
MRRARPAYTQRMRTPVLVLLALFPALALAESAGGLRWTMPAGWKAEAARPMRAATYTIAPTPGDKDSAECAVFFFGPGQGGSVGDNIERWRSQMLGPDGKTALAKIDKHTARGLTVTMVDSSGSYTGMGGPMATAQRAVPNYRLLGAVVEGPRGSNIFIKFTGPQKTVAANQQKYQQLLDSIQVEN